MIIKNGSCQQTESENICQKYPGNLIVANPYDCYSFYACQYGNAMKIICPNDSMFNPKLGNCDSSYTDCTAKEYDGTLNDNLDKTDVLSEDMEYHDDDDDDVGATNSDNTETVTNSPTDTTPITSTNASTEDPTNCETDPEQILPYVQCPTNDTESPSFLPSDSFCDSFFLCYHGRPFEMFCPIGYYWSQEHERCILERESNCTDASAGNKIPKCPLNGQFFIPHSERCNLFYYCENGIRSIQQCTAFKHWDVIEQTCKLDMSAKCIKTLPRSQRAKYYTL